MPTQEPVRNYPRPPIMEPVPQRIRIEFAEHTIADSTRAQRILETSHPPTYYIPKEDFLRGIWSKSEQHSVCEWKGVATYWSLNLNDRCSLNAGWSYEDPTPDFEAIRGYIAVYSSRVDACFVGEEKVQAQSGTFYGGWINSWIEGPFK